MADQNWEVTIERKEKRSTDNYPHSTEELKIALNEEQRARVFAAIIAAVSETGRTQA